MNPSTKTTTLAGLALAAGSLQAAVIYSDIFSDTGNLIGSSPDLGVGTWTGSTQWNEDGITATISGGDDGSAFLAFTPTDGNIYTLSATVSVPSTGWLALGFAATDTNGGEFWEDGTAPWVIIRSSCNVDSCAQSLSSAVPTAEVPEGFL